MLGLLSVVWEVLVLVLVVELNIERSVKNILECTRSSHHFGPEAERPF